MLLLGVAGYLMADSGDRTRTAEPPGPRVAPAFGLEDVRGNGMATFTPGAPTVINFFASWCGPCKEEMPALQAAAQRSAGQVAFVGVGHQDSRTRGVDMLEETGVTYPAAYDPQGSVAAAYGLRRGLPATVFVAADGTIRETVLGPLDLDELNAKIQHLLTLRSDQ